LRKNVYGIVTNVRPELEFSRETKTGEMSSPGSNGDEDHFRARMLQSFYEVLLEL